MSNFLSEVGMPEAFFPSLGDDWHKYVMRLKYDHHIKSEEIAKHDNINTMANITVCMVSSAAWLCCGHIHFIFRIVCIMLSFFVYDFVCSLINHMLCRCYDKCYEVILTAQVQKYMQLDCKGRADFLQEWRKKKSEADELINEKKYKKSGCMFYNVCSDSNCKNCLAHDYQRVVCMQKDVERLCMEAVSKQEKEEKELEQKKTENGNTDFLNASDVLKQAERKASLCPEVYAERYAKVIGEAKQFMEEAKANPLLAEKLNKIFNIYLRELIFLLDTYDEMQGEDKRECTDSFGIILDKFSMYIIHARDSFKAENKMKFRISSKLLQESLDNEIKKNGGRNDV